ncbi:MAG: glycerol kinase GlpK [Chloroflexota bacterium]
MRDDALILALDQGTTSSRAILFDRAGGMAAVAQRAVRASYPEPGWVNQDPMELWRTTLDCAREALAAPGIGPERVAAIAIANQRETTVLWDRSGVPVAPAIVWQSRQSAPVVEAIAARGMTGEYQARTGLVPDAYFSGTKIAWLLDRDPALRVRAEAGEIRFGTVESWLLWNLSGGAVHATDASNAARTMLMDLDRREWDPVLLADLGIPAAMLPEIIGNAGVVCETDPALFGRPIPVSGMAGDQQAALFGQACFAPGDAKNTYGTGSFMLMNAGPTPAVSRNRLLSTVGWVLPAGPTYALEGAVFVTGSAVQWLRDGLGIISDAAGVEALAASVPDAGGVMFVPALTGLGAPWWDADARGTIVGLTRGSTAGHIARATLDAIAHQCRDVADAMGEDSGVALASLRVDGGAAANDLLMQTQADLLGVPVVRPATIETTALGAASLAALGVGLASGLEEIAANWRVDRVFEPTIGVDERETRHERWRRAVARSLDWA